LEKYYGNALNSALKNTLSKYEDYRQVGGCREELMEVLGDFSILARNKA